MTPERWRQVAQLFDEALELEMPLRAAFLAEACAEDNELRREVETLLTARDRAGEFLNRNAAEIEAAQIAAEQFYLPPGQRIDHFELLAPLGAGAMGEVYLARDTRLDRRLALKLLPARFTRDAARLRRFEREARAASALNHPNIITIYETGVDGEHHFIATEFVDGVTLRNRMAGGPLKFDEAISIATQIAAALEAAHAVGIVHRDIKPENVMVRPDGVVKVLDFGIAKLTEKASTGSGFKAPPSTGHSTERGTVIGTPGYMSPEQARSQEVDARTDIWSWGVVLYEMLVGQSPFTGTTNSDIIAEILKSEPPLSQIGLPGSLMLILQRSLSKDRDERFAAIPELLNELRNLKTQEEADGLGESSLSRAGDKNQTLIPSIRSVNSWRKATIKLALKWLAFVGAGGLLAVALGFAIYSLVGRYGTPREGSAGPPLITHLTKDGRIMDAAISIDARLLAYAPIESGKQSLWIRDLESGEEWQLLPPDTVLYWGMRFTPDGQSLLYNRRQPNNTSSLLYRIPVRGRQSHKLAENINSPPAISSDGTQIAFVRSDLARHRDVLIILNANGTSEQEIASRQRPENFSLSGLSWSPDSKLIALGVGRSNETKFAIIAIPVNGGAPIELTPWLWAAVGGVAWDSDGHTLIFSARELGTRVLQLWRLSSSGGKMQRITDDQNAYEEVTLAQSGNTLVTIHTYEISNIWAVRSSGTHRRLTTKGMEGADGLAVTPAGRFVYTVGEYEQSILWSMKIDGSDRKPLTDNTGFLPSASLDGRFIAYVSTEKGVHHIWLMDTNGRNNKQLTDGPGEFSPSITPDGNWVVYASLGKGRNSLWKISTSNGHTIQLTSGFIARKPVVSPDGTMIACSYREKEVDEWKIAILSLDGGRLLKTVVIPYYQYQVIRWAPDNKALVYPKRLAGVDNLWKQSLDGSAPSQITYFTEDLILHYDVLNTGSEFVLSRGGRRRDIALVKGFK
jgi:eukaryotic-like serine/threonine-protein kinase